MALQGVQMPSIAGVYGVKDFREDLRPDGGLGKLAQMAMNLYQFKSGQAQQKEMQDAAQKFNAEQNEIQRNWQTAEKDKERQFYAQQQADAKAAEDAQKIATWQKDANYVGGLGYDAKNDASMVQTQNNIRKVIEDGLAMGKSKAELAPLYKRINEIQADRNDLGKTVAKNNTVKDIQATISEGAIDTAMGDIADAVGNGIIDQRDADKLMVRLLEKKQQQKETKYNWNRKVKSDIDADKKKAAEDWSSEMVGG
jgi:hypothetical protein